MLYGREKNSYRRTRRSWKRSNFRLWKPLIFLTGSRYLSTVGTITGKLNFKHQNMKERKRVTVSTCAYGLLFPVTQRYTSEQFTENIVYDILNSPWFRKVWVATILDNVLNPLLYTFSIQVAWRKTLFIFVKSIGIRVSFVLFCFALFFRGEGLVFVCFTQQSSLLKPVHLFILLIIWSYVFVFNRELLLFMFIKPNIFILFEKTGYLRKIVMQNIVKCYIR